MSYSGSGCVIALTRKKNKTGAYSIIHKCQL